MKIVFIFLVTLLYLSCQKVVIDDKDVQHGPGYFDDVFVYTDKPESQIKYAKHMTRKRKFDKAIETYLKLYEDKNIKSEYREESLYNLGLLFSNMLYPQRDDKKSRYYFEKLLDEFPQSKFKDMAKEKLEYLKQ